MVYVISFVLLFDLCINYQFRINNLCKKVSYWNGLLKVFKLEKDFLIIGEYFIIGTMGFSC